MGLENRLSTLAGSLSGGQRQALALIMATMIRPDLLLLDEHTAALDPKSSDTVMMLTDKIVHEKNITTIMVTHNLRHAVEHGTRTVMMHNGEAIMDVSGAEKDNKTCLLYTSSIGSNEEFLRQSNIHVDFHSDCAEHIDRLHELIFLSLIHI